MEPMKKQKIDALWAHVHWLGVLAETGSYTAAALRLAVSKAAMSQRIGELEAAAGTNAAPTPAPKQTSGKGKATISADDYGEEL